MAYDPGYGPQVAWTTGICDCCLDCESCILGWCFPCVLFGRNKQLLTGEDCCGACCTFCLVQWCAGCCLPCFTMTARTDLRRAQNLAKEPCGDCCTHYWCLPCALCQEHRQMKMHGVSPVNPVFNERARLIAPAPMAMPVVETK
mmetsp:Transcript_8573/g.31674  ORF Transcript_8573/g.31674 Transcript_8573/m.31674 type:complete len:144 (+) Transcript_8573:190-621(+)